MAEQYQTRSQITPKTMLFASAAGLVIAGPLLAFMGFTFLATMALLLVAFPLLILSSPVLIGGVFVFAAAMLGFAVAAAMAMAGLWALGFVLRSVGVTTRQLGFGAGARMTEKLTESGAAMKDSWAGPLEESVGKLAGESDDQQTVENSPENPTINKQ